MIHLFDNSRRTLLFPVNWANSVVRWICGVHSPTGTINVRNELNPGEGTSLALDVNIKVVSDRVAAAMDHLILKKDDVISILTGSIDGVSIVAPDGLLQVSEDWIKDAVARYAETPDDLTHDDISDWDSATADFLNDDDIGVSVAAQGDVDDVIDAVEGLTDLVEGILDDYLTSGDIGVAGGAAAYSHTHTHDKISDWGSATADFLTDADLAALEEDVADIADWAAEIDAALYDASGNKAWVDLSSNQTIRGSKKFSANGTATALYVLADNEEMFQIRRGADVDSSALIYSPNRPMRIFANNKKILLEGSANSVVLSASPTAGASETGSKAVATCGWAANLFSAKTHHHDDVYSKLGHTHSGYASTNHTHSGYASANHNHAGVYAASTHQHVAADITDLGTAIDGKITTFSNTVSSTYATKSALSALQNLVNEIDADLADVIDYVDSMDEDIADLAAWYATGRTGTLTLGGVVSWTGTQLKQDKHVVTFTNGLITNVVTTAGMVIDTPILFEQS